MWIANEVTRLVHLDDCEFATGISYSIEFEELYHALAEGYQEAGCCLTDNPYTDYSEYHEENKRRRLEADANGCDVCGESRCIERAHIRPRRIGGKRTMFLCPLHHRAYDEGKLHPHEIMALVEQHGAVIEAMHGAVADLR